MKRFTLAIALVAVAILLALYQGKTPAEALAVDAQGAFAALGLKEHLTPQRSNGFASMVERIRRDAQAAQGATWLMPDGKC